MLIRIPIAYMEYYFRPTSQYLISTSQFAFIYSSHDPSTIEDLMKLFEIEDYKTWVNPGLRAKMKPKTPSITWMNKRIISIPSWKAP
ncbi:hypothetical protein ACS0TY_005692 [Phlomoides rotata]